MKEEIEKFSLRSFCFGFATCIILCYCLICLQLFVNSHHGDQHRNLNNGGAAVAVDERSDRNFRAKIESLNISQDATLLMSNRVKTPDMSETDKMMTSPPTYQLTPQPQQLQPIKNERNSTQLLLASAFDTEADDFDYFLSSLRKHSSDTVVMVVINSPVSETHRKVAITHNVGLVEYDASEFMPAFLRRYDKTTLRWFLYRHLLESSENFLRNSFDKVVVMNLGKTEITADPFADITDKRNMFITYGTGATMANNTQTAADLSRCIGLETYYMLNKLELIQNDVLQGSMNSLYDYVVKMTNILGGSSVIGKGFPNCEQKHVDIAVHNVVIYEDLLMVSDVRRASRPKFVVKRLPSER